MMLRQFNIDIIYIVIPPTTVQASYRRIAFYFGNVSLLHVRFCVLSVIKSADWGSSQILAGRKYISIR